MRLRILVLILAAWALFSTGQQATAQMVMGAGMESCGEWLKDRAVEGNPGSQNYRDLASLYQLYAWIDGFLSGANSAKYGNVDMLASKPDTNALHAYVDNYCKSHPLDYVASAAFELLKELVSRAH